MQSVEYFTGTNPVERNIAIRPNVLDHPHLVSHVNDLNMWQFLAGGYFECKFPFPCILKKSVHLPIKILLFERQKCVVDKTQKAFEWILDGCFRVERYRLERMEDHLLLVP